MKQSYRTNYEFSGRAMAAGEKIVRLLLDEEITYQEADDALSVAQERLMQTVPTAPTCPR